MYRFILVVLVALAMPAALSASPQRTAYDPFPHCSPKAVPGSVSVVLIGPCKVVPGQITQFKLKLTNGLRRNLSMARVVFGTKNLVVRSSLPYKDENPEETESRLDWNFTNVPAAAQRTVTLWLKFTKTATQSVTGYILWLEAKPKGQSSIWRQWTPILFFK